MINLKGWFWLLNFNKGIKFSMSYDFGRFGLGIKIMIKSKISKMIC